MGLLQQSTADTITFRQGDNPPTRARKLELLRGWLLDQINDLQTQIDDAATATPPIAASSNSFERVRAWWDVQPGASQTLLIWPFAEKVTFQADFSQAVGFIGGAVSAAREIAIYKNPIFTGNVITGGDVIGTVTIATDGTFTFATTDGQDIRFDVNDTLAAKWPAVMDAGADDGAFVLYALFGWIEGYYLLLAGDEQNGDNDLGLLLAGDAQDSGHDVLLLTGV